MIGEMGFKRITGSIQGCVVSSNCTGLWQRGSHVLCLVTVQDYGGQAVEKCLGTVQDYGSHVLCLVNVQDYGSHVLCPVTLQDYGGGAVMCCT